MRVGNNPNKNKEVDPPKEITVGLLVGIPTLSGYFSEMLNILHLCISSLKKNTTLQFDLLIIDNGSCLEVKKYLQDLFDRNQIDIFICNSRNVGRPNGVRQVLNSAPGDIIVYSDCDVFFYQGWLEKQVELFKSIPNIGLLGGYPVKKLTYRHTNSTFRWIDSSPIVKVEKGDIIDKSWSYDFLISTGSKDPERDYESWKEFEDVRVEFNNVTAFVGASHMEFMTSKEIIKTLPHYRFDKMTGLNDMIIDQVIDDNGMLRLTTEERVIYHIGNTIKEPWLKEELKKLGEIKKSLYSYIKYQCVDFMLRAIRSLKRRIASKLL